MTKLSANVSFTFVWGIFRGESPWHSNDSWYLGSCRSLQHVDTKSILMLHEMQHLKKHSPTKCVHYFCHMYFQRENNEKLKNILLLIIKRIFNFDTVIDISGLLLYFFFFFLVLIINWHTRDAWIHREKSDEMNFLIRWNFLNVIFFSEW